MIKIYTSKNEQLLEKTSVGFENAVWIDIINPTQEEEWLIENHFNVSVPSITEIDDIEVSRRFYSENKIHYLTAYMFLKLDGLISIYVSKNDYNKTVNK